MKPSEPSVELDAFQRGFVFWESPKVEYMPPSDDAGRREWLEGFLQAHADYPDTLDPEEGEAAQEALDRMLGRIIGKIGRSFKHSFYLIRPHRRLKTGNAPLCFCIPWISDSGPALS